MAKDPPWSAITTAPGAAPIQRPGIRLTRRVDAALQTFVEPEVTASSIALPVSRGQSAEASQQGPVSRGQQVRTCECSTPCITGQGATLFQDDALAGQLQRE